MQISEVTHSVFFCTCNPHGLTDLSTATPHVIRVASSVVTRMALTTYATTAKVVSDLCY